MKQKGHYLAATSPLKGDEFSLRLGFGRSLDADRLYLVEYMLLGSSRDVGPVCVDFVENTLTFPNGV